MPQPDQPARLPLPPDSPLVVEAFKATCQAGRTAMQTAVLINGAAALAFLSQVKDAHDRKTAVGVLVSFGLGVLLAGASQAVTYFVQLTQSNAWNHAFDGDWDEAHRAMRAASPFNHVAILLGTGSYLGFGVGLGLAYLALT